MKKRGLLERLDTDGVICAEGYLFEMERRGYLTAGEFVPEVALEHPEALHRLHKDFQHAGSDVIQAFTYNAHREKLRIISGCTCPAPHGRTFPTALDPLYCNRYEIRQFAQEACGLGVRYLGVCCGAAPIHIREVAEAMGRRPPASRYAANMRKHFMYGDDDRLPDHITAYGDRA